LAALFRCYGLDFLPVGLSGFWFVIMNLTDPVAVRSKAWVFGRSLARIVVSNPTGGMDVCVVFVVRTVAWNVK
jgi:hypothetical protein